MSAKPLRLVVKKYEILYQGDEEIRYLVTKCLCNDTKVLRACKKKKPIHNRITKMDNEHILEMSSKMTGLKDGDLITGALHFDVILFPFIRCHVDRGAPGIAVANQLLEEASRAGQQIDNIVPSVVTSEATNQFLAYPLQWT